MGGTFTWMAPEVYRGWHPRSSSDAFSFGFLAYLLATGRTVLPNLPLKVVKTGMLA